VLVVALASCASEPLITFERSPGRLRILADGRPVATYRHDDPHTTRPFFEHLRTPSGVQVTRNHPPVGGRDLDDHPTFHPGLWLAFGDLDGADPWRNRDPVRHEGFADEPRGGPGAGSFAVRHRYLKGDRGIALELCRIEIRALPDAYRITWRSEFTPIGDELAFGDQEEMGLGVRMATPLAVVRGGRILDSEGRTDEAQVWGKAADWCSYAGRLDGKPVGVALMPDPANFRRCWFHARDYGLLVANPFGRNALAGGEKSRVVLRRGETLRLRFGILVYDGRPDLGAAYRDFAASTR
jgi:hypothetical protein